MIPKILKQMYPFSKYSGTSMMQIPKIHKKGQRILVGTIDNYDFEMAYQVTALE